MRVCITMDADWAVPEVTAYATSLLRDAGAPYTLFLTDDQQAPEDPLCAYGLHPNFHRAPPDKELGRLRALFPMASGLRPHRHHLPPQADAALLQRHGIRWLSTGTAPDQHQFSSCLGLRNRPSNWGDNLFFWSATKPDLQKMSSTSDGVYVLIFHPIHIYLNTVETRQYEEAKPHYKDISRLAAYRNTARCGVRDVLFEVLALFSHRRIDCVTLDVVAAADARNDDAC